VLDMMIHDIDIVLMLAGDRNITGVQAVGVNVIGSTEDIANARVSFSNGCVANITASRATEHKVRTLAITQPDAYIFLGQGSFDATVYADTPESSKAPTKIAITPKKVAAAGPAGTLTLDLAAAGGAAIQIRPATAAAVAPRK